MTQELGSGGAIAGPATDASVGAARGATAGSAPEAPQLAWRRAPGWDEAQLQERAQALGVDPLALGLWLGRGVAEADLARVATPKLRDLTPPAGMAGFPEALDLLTWAQSGARIVGIFGDYDVDGVSTATILAGFLEALGVPVLVRVAHRERGYGLAPADVDAFAQAGVQLLLTGDTGTSDLESLALARQRGLRTVVIDHHQVPETMPPTDALINPHQVACRFPFKGLCSAGVAFYLCAALRSHLGQAGVSSVPDPRQWLDLVALATVCDMMPLVGENRILVHRGLADLATVRRPGLVALLEQSGGVPAEVDEQTLGFRIGPRINAPGRLGPADPALRLLRAKTLPEAQPLAEHVEALNAKRKTASAQALREAQAHLSQAPGRLEQAAIWVADPSWSPGVVGLAAANLAETYRRPAMVLAIDQAQGLARGSVRTWGGVDVRQALAACADVIERFGGHREAAGLSVRADRVAAAGEAFIRACAAQGGALANASTTFVDGEVSLAEIDVAWVRRIRRAGPFGVGFATPRWLGHAEVTSARIYKDRHVGLRLRHGGVERAAIAFGQASWAPRVGQRLGFLFAPSVDEYRGQVRVQLIIEQMWPATLTA